MSAITDGALARRAPRACGPGGRRARREEITIRERSDSAIDRFAVLGERRAFGGERRAILGVAVEACVEGLRELG